jgi:putative ATP-binding cassette transporter
MRLSVYQEVLTFLFRRSRRSFFFAFVAGVVSGVCSAALLALISSALDHSEPNRSGFVVFLSLCLLALFTKVMSERLLIAVGQESLLELRIGLSQDILEIPLHCVENLGIGKILSVLVDDVPSVSGLSALLPTLLVNLAVVTSCTVYMAWINLHLFLIVIAIVVPGAVSYHYATLFALQHFKRARQHHDALQEHFQTLLGGIKELKLNSRRRALFVEEDLKGTATAIRKENVDGMAIYSWASNWGQLLIFVVLGTLIFIVPRNSPFAHSPLAAFVVCLIYVSAPLQSLISSLPALGRAAVSIRAIEEMTQLRRVSADTHCQAVEAVRSVKRVELVDLTYEYEKDDRGAAFVLSLQFSHGEITFIVGGNGSGKSTLLKVLVGLYAPGRGKILLDGIPVIYGRVEQYRQCFSTIFSETFLFDRLVGPHDCTSTLQIGEYLSLLQLAEKVEIINGRFSTTRLSSGERKRLALLSAYVEDRAVYVFDEWAANQAPEFKRVFYYHLLPELKQRGKAVIVATHDERYFDAADHIVRLEAGRSVAHVSSVQAAGGT